MGPRVVKNKVGLFGSFFNWFGGVEIGGNTSTNDGYSMIFQRRCWFTRNFSAGKKSLTFVEVLNHHARVFDKSHQSRVVAPSTLL